MVSQARIGTFSPNPTGQPLHTGVSHSTHPSQTGAALSAAASPGINSPTGNSSLTKIVVAQVNLLLSTIKEDKEDPHKWDLQVESLRKLIDDNGMDVFAKYFTRLVAANASQIFPGLNRSGANPGNNHHLLVAEMRKLSVDFAQGRLIAESIETGTEDIFRDFDLSTFMEHFKLDALEKTVLALAFKVGSRPDLKTKADAILSTNFPFFVNLLSRPNGDHGDLDPDFIAELLDRFIQVHPPNFNAAAKKELEHKVQARYSNSPDAKPPPSQVLAALDLVRVLVDKPPNALALYIHRTGVDFTSDEETCAAYLESRPTNQISEEQVAVALIYTTISRTLPHNPSVLVAALRRVIPTGFTWQHVVSYFDHASARITSEQFLRLYKALLPIASDPTENFKIHALWGGDWDHPETQLSFICAYAGLTPEQLDASTIPGVTPTFRLEEYAQAPSSVQMAASRWVKHPLVSEEALKAVFSVALASMHASQSTEAKRLFQDVVVPNLPVFVVSAFGVPKPWPAMAEETLVSLVDSFISKQEGCDFVLNSLWRRDKEWLKQRLTDTHALKPLSLPLILDHALKHGWVDELAYMHNLFGLDFTALAHAGGYLDLHLWARRNADRSTEVVKALLHFLMIKSKLEGEYQRPSEGQISVKSTTSLQVRTVSALLQIVEEFLPKTPFPELIIVQRHCITMYPRLINYGEGFDDIIDANGREGNALPPAANSKMEEHYKKMYSDEIEVRDVVEVLGRYKHSRNPLDQDIFACMIHGLFDEYSHYVDYPLEALATTAVLFGGIISHKLISDLPLQIGLGMILEAVRDHAPEESMYKFGLQALMQLFARLREWPGFCKQLLQIPGLQGTDARNKAEDVVRDHEEDMLRSRNGGGGVPSNPLGALGEALANGNVEETNGGEQHAPPFASIHVDPRPLGADFEDPSDDAQGKIQFVLNNLTETTLQAMFRELREMLDARHQQWFASHLVEERAKMQPNYHQVYLDLVKQFEDRALWAEVLRETYASVARMLNSEVTMQNSTERTHLKNLGGWLGLLTLARDQPIKHKNMAFKQLLIEAHDTKRLIVVIPFVCKVLTQGATSNVFRPPNPWLMDIIHLLIELYHNAELKLNLKFEIEVLCKGLNLDHKSIEPSGEILNRVPIEETAELMGQDALDSFESLSLNGIGAGVAGALSPHAMAPAIPDLGPSLSIPQTEVVTQSRLHDIVRTALTRALQDIIQPVVDRSVTIAAISTREMIHKDFATEPDENKLRTAAINMVKSTAGSLALVTSKEPLRANFTNYLRNLSNDLPQGLPEGIIIMCVNSNLEMASSVIEKSAEERAVPEIEEMLEGEIEARRRHRIQRPSEPYMDGSLSRWAWTIPHPYKLSPGGLNKEQMAIYDDFARHPRTNAAPTAPSHVPSTSDATRSTVNEVLQEQYSSIPSIPTPAETPSLPSHIAQQNVPYAPVSQAPPNRQGAGLNQMEARALADRVAKLLQELQRVAVEAPEEHFADLPRPHPVLDLIDALVQLIIKTQQTSDEFATFAAVQISQLLLTPLEDSLALESLVHVLETVRKIAGPVGSHQIRTIFTHHPGHMLLHLPLIAALLGTDLLDWQNIDVAMAQALEQRKEGSIRFLEQLMDLALLNESPLALYADFIRSLEEAWAWIAEDPEVSGGQQFKSKILSPPAPMPSSLSAEELSAIRLEQMDYVFDEWVHLSQNPQVSDKISLIFVQQMRSRQVVTSKEDFFLFARQAIDKSVDRFEQALHTGSTLTEAYQAIDSLAKMVVIFLQSHDVGTDGQSPRATFLDSTLALGVLVLNHHHLKRGEHFNQRVFFRFFSMILHHVSTSADQLSQDDRDQMSLKFAGRFLDLEPALFPGFIFGWIGLISHRLFFPALLQMRGDVGWAPYSKLLERLLSYLSEILKPYEIPPISKEVYHATLKLLFVLQHDYPEFIVAISRQLCENLPPHASQLTNMILFASPSSASKMPDPITAGAKADRLGEGEGAPRTIDNPARFLQQIGLYDILEYSLQDGPSEDAIAQISHTINDVQKPATSFGFVPVTVNRQVIDTLVAVVGNFATDRAASQGCDAPVFVPGSSDIKTLHLLVTELGPEARYYLLSAMVNQLRFANAAQQYFSQALLDIFGHDLSDPEQTDIRQQIVRIFLERLVGFWPQPWGLLVTIAELIKNEKYQFFDLPFIKSAPEVAERFAALLSRN